MTERQLLADVGVVLFAFVPGQDRELIEDVTDVGFIEVVEVEAERVETRLELAALGCIPAE